MIRVVFASSMKVKLMDKNGGIAKMNKGWLKNEDGFKECLVTKAPNSNRLRLRMIGGHDDGQEIEIFDGHVSRKDVFPVLHIGDEPPKEIFEHKKTWLPICGKALSKQEEDLVPPQEIFVFQPHTKDVLISIIRGGHTILYGKPGVGKTAVVNAIASRIRKPVVRVNVNSQTTCADFVGTWTIKGGETIFLEGPLVKAMRNGWWFICDEIDALPPDVAFLLYPVLEKPSLLTLKEKDGEVVRAHPDFRFFGTGNSIGGDPEGIYAGTQPLNRALKDRFGGHGMMINVLPMTPAQERWVVAGRVPVLPDSLVKRVVKMAGKLRQGGRIFSTRTVINFAEHLVIYRNAVDAAERTFMPLMCKTERPDDPDRVAITDILKAEFGRRIILSTRIVQDDGSIVDLPEEQDKDELPILPQEGDADTLLEDAEARLRKRAIDGNLVSNVTDEAELAVIWKSFHANGGPCKSHAKVEEELGLKPNNGMTALRCMKKYEKLVKNRQLSLA